MDRAAAVLDTTEWPILDEQSMDRRFDWKRFWCPREGSFALDGFGFLFDPGPDRRHIYNPAVVSFGDIAKLPCLVLLGEPGLGKTVALDNERSTIERRVAESGELLLWKDLNAYQTDAWLVRSVFEDEAFRCWLNGTGVLHLFLDSLDECLIRITSLVGLLSEQLQKCPVDRLRLRIACRTAVWPTALEATLDQLWGEENVGIFELLPLRRVDVADACRQSGIETDAFLSEVIQRHVGVLAARPLTLRFLLNTFRRTGGFPSKQTELYLQGCKILCEEPSPNRRSARLTGSLTAHQRLLVASRIAALSVFCGRPTISTKMDLGDLPEGCATPGDVLGGTEEADATSVEVTQSALRETLDTGLFTARAPDCFGFAHRTYAEFLAAYYLVSHRMSDRQMASLILHPDEAEGQVVPQLHETAAWLASLHPAIFDQIMDCDAQVLLRSDVSNMDESSRENLVGAYLRLVVQGEAHDRDWNLRNLYQKLKHHRLADQLTPFIQDRAKDAVTRRVAIDIAEECEVSALQDLLANIATDSTEDHNARVQAAYAVSRIGDDTTKLRLRPCIASEAGEDPDDELKGIALAALWPDHLSVTDVFAALTPPKRRNFAGAYKHFLWGFFPDQLTAADLPIALEWARTQETDFDGPFHELVEKITCKAWEQLDAPGVIGPFAEGVLDRLAKYERTPGIRFSHDADLPKRRRLMETIVPMLVERAEDPRRFIFAADPIVFAQDVPWLIEKIVFCKSQAQQGIWAKLIGAAFDWQDREQFDLVIVTARSCSALASEFAWLLQPVELNSVRAEEMKKNYRESLELQERSKSRRRLLEPPPDKRVEMLLDRFEAGDLEAWWRLNMELTLEPTDTHYPGWRELEPNVLNLPGWKAASDHTRQRIVNAAKEYVLRQTSHPEEWVEKNLLYRSDFAGYRGLLLMAHHDASVLASLPEKIWKNWAPVILAYPTSSGVNEEKQHQVMVRLAYEHAPGEIAQTLLVLIDKENREHSLLVIHRKVALCWDAELGRALLDKAKDANLKPSCMGDLLEALLEHDTGGAAEFAESLIRVPVPSDPNLRQRALVAAERLLCFAGKTGWPKVWSGMQLDAEFGRELILKVADRHDQTHAALLARGLTEDQIADLYVWLERHFLRADDPEHDDVHVVGPRESVSLFRDALLQQLKHRGTAAARRAVERLVAELPDLSWMKWVAIDARAITLQATWNPPRPSDLLKMARDRRIRLVESESQLLAVVIESLQRLEQELQGETPAAPDLWDQIRDGVFRPKDEGHFADYVARHLRRDLGVIANREVEVRRGEGDATGERTDILVAATTMSRSSRSVDSLKVIIEAKGCWNRQLLTAMRTQLTNRYLRDNQCRHGLYLVGWFNCPQWDENDHRKKRVPVHSIDELRTALNTQAIEVSRDGLAIETCVVNAALR